MTIRTLLPGVLLSVFLLFLFSCQKENIKETAPDLTNVSLKGGGGTYRLLTCADEDIGTVTVTQNFGVIMVRYETIGDFKLTSTRIHAEYDWLDIPQTPDGSPILEAFDYQYDYAEGVQSFTMMLDEDFYGRFYIACYASYTENADCPTLDAWAMGYIFPGSECAMYRYFYPYNGKNPQPGDP